MLKIETIAKNLKIFWSLQVRTCVVRIGRYAPVFDFICCWCQDTKLWKVVANISNKVTTCNNLPWVINKNIVNKTSWGSVNTCWFINCRNELIKIHDYNDQFRFLPAAEYFSIASIIYLRKFPGELCCRYTILQITFFF